MQSVSCILQDCTVSIHIQSAHHSSPFKTLNYLIFKKKYCWNKLLRTGKSCLWHRTWHSSDLHELPTETASPLGLTKPCSNPSPFAHVIFFLLGHELNLSCADQLSLQILSVLQKGCRFVLHHSQSWLADSFFGRDIITVSRTITFTQS